MLRSLSYMAEIDKSYAQEVKVTEMVYELRKYFVYFANSETLADDCMHIAILHTLGHFKGNDIALGSYIKNLARNLPKVLRNEKTDDLDFLEDVVASTGEILTEKTEKGTLKHRTPSSSLESEVISKVMMEGEDFSDMYEMIIDNMPYFLMLGEAIKTHNTAMKKFSEQYKATCLKLAEKYDNFSGMVIQLYQQYKDQIEEYLDLDNVADLWREADYTLFNKIRARRNEFKLLNSDTENQVEDADVEPFFAIHEGLKGQRLYRINYADIWHEICEFAKDSPINPMHMTIGNQEQWRTLGGSVVLNDGYNGFCKVQKDELLTNLILFTNTTLVNVGSSSIYLLGNISLDVLKFNVKSINLDFVIEDITDKIEYFYGKVF